MEYTTRMKNLSRTLCGLCALMCLSACDSDNNGYDTIDAQRFNIESYSPAASESTDLTGLWLVARQGDDRYAHLGASYSAQLFSLLITDHDDDRYLVQHCMGGIPLLWTISGDTGHLSNIYVKKSAEKFSFFTGLLHFYPDFIIRNNDLLEAPFFNRLENVAFNPYFVDIQSWWSTLQGTTDEDKAAVENSRLVAVKIAQLSEPRSRLGTLNLSYLSYPEGNQTNLENMEILCFSDVQYRYADTAEPGLINNGIRLHNLTAVAKAGDNYATVDLTLDAARWNKETDQHYPIQLPEKEPQAYGYAKAAFVRIGFEHCCQKSFGQEDSPSRNEADEPYVSFDNLRLNPEGINVDFSGFIDANDSPPDNDYGISEVSGNLNISF